MSVSPPRQEKGPNSVFDSKRWKKPMGSAVTVTGRASAARREQQQAGAREKPSQALARFFMGGRATVFAGAFSENSSASLSVMAPPSSSASTMVTARL